MRKPTFCKHNIQTNNPKLNESAYKTYVCPLVEYAASVRDPWQDKYIDKIEMIQQSAQGHKIHIQ